MYKLTGPVLIKQDLSEARGNVESVWIISEGGERAVGEGVGGARKKQRDKQQGIIELQQKMMQLANPSGEGRERCVVVIQ